MITLSKKITEWVDEMAAHFSSKKYSGAMAHNRNMICFAGNWLIKELL